MTQEEIMYLKTAYPEVITKEQFYKICHISKRTASFLLESGRVRNTNSGKQTRKYKIRLDDVIDYLEQRGENEIYYKAPDNYYRDNSEKKLRIEISSFDEEQITQIRAYILRQMEKRNDVLSLTEISKVIGYSTKTIYDWYTKHEIAGFLIKNKVRIPKEYLIDFLMSERAFQIAKKTPKHIRLIKEAVYAIQ